MGFRTLGMLSMNRPTWRSMLTCMLLVFYAAGVSAQSSGLSTAVLQADPLSTAQQDQLSGFVQSQTQRLSSPDAQVVVEAREALIDVFSREIRDNASDTFRSAYAQSVAAALLEAMPQLDTLGKVNALLVAAHVVHADNADVILFGLQDDNPAVRYLAAKAVQGVASRAQLDDSLPLSTGFYTQILDALGSTLPRESSDHARSMMMLAIAEIDRPQAVQTLIAALNARLQTHIADPTLVMSGEAASIERLFTRLTANDTDAEAYRSLMALGLRYLHVANAQLRDAGAGQDADPEPSRAQLIIYVDRFVLQDGAARVFNRLDQLPPLVNNAVNRRDWDFIDEQIQAWRQLLAAPPFNIPAGELLAP